MEGKITYFDRVGRENTEAALTLAKRRAEELGIKTVLIASTQGDTAAKAVDIFTGMKVVAVGHATGFREPNVNEFTDANKKYVESRGGIVLFAGHSLTGVTRRPSPPAAPGAGPAPMPAGPILDIGEVIATTLRMFSQGMKVVVEIAAMAADAGLVRVDEDVLAIGGTGRGADTVVILRPAYSRDLFKLRIKEILAKPIMAPGPGAPPPAAAPGVPAAVGAGRPGA